LYLVSPEVRSGYSEPAFVEDDERLEGVSLAGGPRCTVFLSFGSTGSGGLNISAEEDRLPGVVFSEMMSRIDLDV
jgi:hypothetical protein